MTDACRHCGREIKIGPTAETKFEWLHVRELTTLDDRMCYWGKRLGRGALTAEPAELALAVMDERMEI